MIYVYCLAALVPDSVKEGFLSWRRRAKQSQETIRRNLFGPTPDTNNQISAQRASEGLRAAWSEWVVAKGSRNQLYVRHVSWELQDKINSACRAGCILPVYILQALPELERVLQLTAHMRGSRLPMFSRDT